MGQPKITLYMDVVSPFGYIAYHIIRNDPVFKDVKLTIIPIFLGGLMRTCNNTAPIAVKNKDRYTNSSRQYWSRTFSVPMNQTMVPNFPPNTLSANRHLASIPISDQTSLLAAFDALLPAFFLDHKDISSPEVYLPILSQALGEEQAKRLAELAPTDGKRVLLENTDQAFKDGAFGLPWMKCENEKGEEEGFFGVDHLGRVCEFLGLGRLEGDKTKALL